jgi:hypothetical protein
MGRFYSDREYSMPNKNQRYCLDSKPHEQILDIQFHAGKKFLSNQLIQHGVGF